MILPSGNRNGNTHIAQLAEGGRGSSYPNPVNFQTLKHFFLMQEAYSTTVRLDATDLITGMKMIELFQQQNIGTDNSKEAANEDDSDVSWNGEFWVKSFAPNTVGQPDIGSGAGSAPVIPPTTSSEFIDLGTDDFLYVVAGHSLTTNASGTSLGLGWPAAAINSNSSFIKLAASSYSSGSYGEPSIAIQDVDGNGVTMPNPSVNPDGSYFGLAGGSVGGKLYPTIWSLCRSGNTLTRRIKTLHKGYEQSHSVDMSSVTGAIRPNAGWLWYDFITYGIAVYQFPNGLPDDVVAACDWHGDNMRQEFTQKTGYPPWVGLV